MTKSNIKSVVTVVVVTTIVFLSLVTGITTLITGICPMDLFNTVIGN
jgi:hypothetical protein